MLDIPSSSELLSSQSFSSPIKNDSKRCISEARLGSRAPPPPCAGFTCCKREALPSTMQRMRDRVPN